MSNRHSSYLEDEGQEQFIHRYNVTAAEAVIDRSAAFLRSILPGTKPATNITGRPLPNGANLAAAVNGKQNIAMRMWGNGSSGTCRIVVLGWPVGTRGHGRILLDGTTFTIGASPVLTGVHPVDDTITESGVSFSPIDEVTLSSGDGATNGPGTNQAFYNLSGHDREGVAVLDTLGLGYVWAQVVSLTTITRVDIGLQRIG